MVFAVLALMAIVAGAATAAPAQGTKPTRVSASFDFAQVHPCFILPPIYGHVEVLAYDDDASFPADPFARQIDRVSITVTRADGTVWEQDPFGVMVGEDGSIYIATSSWHTGFRLYDGGNPGSGFTGSFDQGVAMTNDWMRYQSFSMCSSSRFYLTSGNIKITRPD